MGTSDRKEGAQQRWCLSWLLPLTSSSWSLEHFLFDEILSLHFPYATLVSPLCVSHLYVHIAQKDKTQISSLRALSYQGTAPTFGVKLVAFQANHSWPLRSNMSRTGMSQFCGNLNLVLKLKWNARIQKKYMRIHEQFRCKTKCKQHTNNIQSVPHATS